MGLAALPDSPIARLVLNDVGPAIELRGARSASAATSARRCTGTRSTRPPTTCVTISQGFGPHTREEWLALTRPMLRPGRRRLHACTTTRRSRVPFKAITPEIAAAGEALLWQAYDAIRCPTLLLRGAESDLLSRATAAGDDAARPARAPARVRRRRPCADAGARRPDRGRARVPARRHEDACGRRVETRRAIVRDSPMRRTSRGVGERRRPRPRARARRADADPVAARARLRRAAAGRPHARHRRGRARRTPTASPRSWPSIGATPAMQAAAYLVYAGDGLQRPTRWSRRPSAPSYASLVDLTRKLVQIQRAAREAQRRAASSARCRPSACARCCSRSRATCASCCCGWRRGCRRCAGFARDARRRARRSWRASRSRCSRRSPTGSASGRSSGSSRTCRSASSSPRATSASRACSTSGASSARRGVDALPRRSSGRRSRAHGLARRRAGPAQAHLQHLEEDAGQGRWTSTTCFDVRAVRVIVADVAGLLRGARPRARALPRGRRRVRRLHRAAQAQRLPVAAHRGARRRRPAVRGPDPHARDARARRARRRRALGLQGGRRQGLRRRQRRGRVRGPGRRGAQGRAAPAARLGARLRRRRRRGAGARPSRSRLRRSHLRLHAAGDA